MIDEYIQRYGRRLYGLCRSLCSSPFDADDLYQETCLRVIKHIDKYDPVREFEPWLTKICVNTYRSRLRRIARSPLLDFSSNEEKDRLLDSLPAPEEQDYSPLYEAVAGQAAAGGGSVLLPGNGPVLYRRNTEDPSGNGKIPAEQGAKKPEGGAC